MKKLTLAVLAATTLTAPSVSASAPSNFEYEVLHKSDQLQWVGGPPVDVSYLQNDVLKMCKIRYGHEGSLNYYNHQEYGKYYSVGYKTDEEKVGYNIHGIQYFTNKDVTLPTGYSGGEVFGVIRGQIPERELFITKWQLRSEDSPKSIIFMEHLSMSLTSVVSSFKACVDHASK